MVSCFPETQPINPVNQVILSVFGDNFFPSYSTEFQPPNRSELTNETLLQIQFPGGGKFKPTGSDVNQTIADYLTPVTGALGAILSFFAPLFIILDVIRALIDMICSLFNPVPLIATVVEFFITVVPPLIALYPPLSSILHALNAAKVITAIAVSLLAQVVPIIDKIVQNALSIPELLLEGNLQAVEAVTIKICTLIQHFSNQLGAFAPIQFVIELVDLFTSLASSFFCVSPSECCSPENCPPIIVNPPTGVARVTRKLNRFTLKDLFDFVFEQINPIIDIIDDFLSDVISAAFTPIEDSINTILSDAIGPIENTINDVIELILNLLFTLNSNLLFGLLNPLIESLGADPADANSTANAFSIDIPDIQLNLSDIDLDLTLTTPDFFEQVVFVAEEMDLGLFQSVTAPDFGNNTLLRDPTASPNGNGRTSEKAVGDSYSRQEMVRLLEYIVDPSKIPAAQDEENPATLRVRMTRVQLADGTPDNTTITRNVAFVSNSVIEQILETLGLSENPTELTTLTIRSEDFEVGDIVEYTIEPDQIALLSLNLIGLGCQDDVASVATGIEALVNADLGAVDVVGGDANTGLDPVQDKTGQSFPPPPVEDLAECLAAQAANPEVSQVDCVSDIINNYIDDVGDYYDNLLCIGASRVSSVFEVNKNFAISNGKDSITVELQVNDIGGNNLLLGKLPNSSASAQFFTTRGAVGPVFFDETTSRFKATITSTEPGPAEITGAFLVNDQVCMIPGQFDGFVVTDKVLDVEFVPEGGTFPRRRRQRVYRQARGGRRR